MNEHNTSCLHKLHQHKTTLGRPTRWCHLWHINISDNTCEISSHWNFNIKSWHVYLRPTVNGSHILIDDDFEDDYMDKFIWSGLTVRRSNKIRILDRKKLSELSIIEMIIFWISRPVMKSNIGWKHYEININNVAISLLNEQASTYLFFETWYVWWLI